LFLRVAEEIGYCKLDQINVGPKRKWYRLLQMKNDQKLFMDQTVKLRLDQKDKRSIKIGIGVQTRMLFVFDCIQLIQ